MKNRKSKSQKIKVLLISLVVFLSIFVIVDSFIEHFIADCQENRQTGEKLCTQFGVGPFQVDHVIISIEGGPNKAIADEIANEMNGEVDAFSETTNSYSLKINTETLFSLNSAIKKLEKDPRIKDVLRAYVPIPLVN